MEAKTDTRSGRSYTFRWYEPGDERDILRLFETVWGEARSEEWFRWRFEANPYLDHAPVFVAENDGTVVGTRPFLPLRLSVGDGTVLGLLTVDTMVHPDHRRRGLFTTMTERAIDYYAAGEPALVFNQPTGDARPGFLSLGFRELDPMTTYFRVQRPSTFIEQRTDSPNVDTLARPADWFATAYHRLSDGRQRRTGDVSVRQSSGVAITELAALYRRSPPSGIAAHRDEQFYEWRFASPVWSRTTYLASVAGEQIAGVLARTRTMDEGITVTQLADIVPLVGGPEWERALAACVEAVLADAGDADVVSAPARVFPEAIASSYGFRPDDEFPLEAAASADAALCVRSLRDEEDRWRVNGVSLCDPSNWSLTFAERDTA